MKIKTLFTFFLLLRTTSIFADYFFSTPEELIEFGIKNSNLIKIQEELSLAKIKSAKQDFSSYLPQLDFSWNEFDSIAKGQSDSRSKNISLSLTQLLFDNGKTKANYLYNRFLAVNENLKLEESLKDYELTLREKFYNLAFINKKIELKESFYQNNLTELSILKFKFQKGLCTETDLLEYEILCNDLENEIIIEKQNLDLAKNELKNLINIKLSEEFSINNNLDFFILESEKLLPQINSLEHQLLINNLTLSQMDRELIFQKQIYKINNRFYFPTIYLSASLAFSGIHYPLTQPNYSFNISFAFDSIPWNKTDFSSGYKFSPNNSNSLQDNFTTKISPQLNYLSNKKIAKLNIKQLEEQIKQTEENSKTNLRNLIYEHDNLLSSIPQIKKTLELKEKKLKLLKFQNENGIITTADFIKEKLNLEESKQSFLQTQFNFLQLQNKIFFLIGKGDFYE